MWGHCRKGRVSRTEVSRLLLLDLKKETSPEKSEQKKTRTKTETKMKDIDKINTYPVRLRFIFLSVVYLLTVIDPTAHKLINKETSKMVVY
jgi:hypothetical protein